MREVNSNTNQFDLTSSFESNGELNNNIGWESEDINSKSNSCPSSELVDNLEKSQLEVSETPNEVERSTKKMDWYKVAHKLREDHRKSLKQIFQLEQDLADVENKLKSQTEKSQNSDRLVAKQAEDAKKLQEEIISLSKKLEASQQEKQSQNLLVENLSQQLISSQKQTAKLERECALLQETCNNQAYQLITKTQQAEELSNRLTRQQRYTLQYKAALDNLLNSSTTAESEQQEINNQSTLEIKNPPIKPWSSSSINPQVSLPPTQAESIKTKTLSQPKQANHNTSKKVNGRHQLLLNPILIQTKNPSLYQQ